jgi:chemotaxis protein CheD
VIGGNAMRQKPAALSAEPSIRPPSTYRFYDAANAAWMVKVFPGEYHVTSQPDEFLMTVLGSCVAACIRDPRQGIGGMNHFMLPQGAPGGWGAESQSARFGNFAMEKLINELLTAGCSRSALEVKVFGGGNVTDSRNAIGTDNARFVLRYLESEGLQCAVQDLGGPYPRRIHYFPATGRVVRRLLGNGDSYAVSRDEAEYDGRLSRRQPGGEVELFNA